MDIERLSLCRSIGLIITRRPLLCRGAAVLKAAVTEFFVPQFVSRLIPGIRPIAELQHPLDSSIPFVPDQIRRYLGYLTVWLKTLQYLHRTFGKPALPAIERMMRDVTRLYYACGSVYRRCQSTTTSRRTRPLDPCFLMIQLFDPHLHCIPSLHVLTICYNYHQAARASTGLGGDDAAGNSAAAQAYRSALRITESVLLVKQHSLLDIGPSLFLLSRMFPDYNDEQIRRFVSDLFADGRLVDVRLAGRIREAILDSYRDMLDLERRRAGAQPTDLVVEFLKGYLRPKRETGRKGSVCTPRASASARGGTNRTFRRRAGS